MGAVSAPDTKGNKAYVAPTERQRAIADGIALDGSYIGRRPGRAAATAARTRTTEDVAAADAAAAEASLGRTRDKDGGGLTPLVYAAREDCLECAKILLERGADVN